MMANFLPTTTTVVASSSEYDNFDCSEQPCNKQPGEFYLKMNSSLVSHYFSSVAVNHITIDNGILNYNSDLHYVRGVENYAQGLKQIDDIESFVMAVLGPQQNWFSYDAQKNRMLIIISERDDPLILSPDFADILGFDSISFSGDMMQYSERAPDIYRDFRPLFLCADMCDFSPVSSTQKKSLLCTIDTSALDPVCNKTHTFTCNFGAFPSCCKKVVSPVPIYMRLTLWNSSFIKVPTFDSCRLTCELTFQSNSFYESL